MELKILLLCFCVALCTYSLIAKAKPDWNPEKAFSNNRTYWIVAAALFAVAIAVRVWKFGVVPSGLNQDEAMAAVDANALAHYGTDRFGTSLPVYFTAWGYGEMNVLLSYCMAPFINLFGLTPFVIRLPMLIASLAGVYVVFRFAGRACGRTVALVTLFFVAIDPWQIMQSRWSLECNLFPHFLLFGTYFLFIGTEKRAGYYLSMVFFGLAMYTYGISFYTVPLLLLIFCVYLLLTKRIKVWETAVCAAVYLLVAWPIFAMLYINYFKLPTLHVGLLTIQYFPDSIRMNDLILYSNDFFSQLLQNIRSLANVVMLESGDYSWSFVAGYGRMFLFTLPFTVTGLIVLFRRSRAKALPDPDTAVSNCDDAPATIDPVGRFLLGAWLLVALISGLMVDNVNTNRINIMFYPIIVLISLGIWHVLFQNIRIKAIAAAVLAVFVFSFAGFTLQYFGDHSKLMAEDFCSGLTDAIHYADGLDTDRLYITTWSRSENASTCSEIYTLFGADMDARYFQGVASENNRTTGKKLLPYKLRYQYINFRTFNFVQRAGSVYVFNEEQDADLFSPKEYTITVFGNFAVAVSKANSGG